MHFRYTILYVDDVNAALDLFERAFGLLRGFVHPEGDYGELSTGATKLAFSSLALMSSLGKSPRRAEADAPCFELAFETEDVDRDYQRALGAGTTAVQEPTEMPWGQTVSYVSALGFLIEICSPVAGASGEQ